MATKTAEYNIANPNRPRTHTVATKTAEFNKSREKSEEKRDDTQSLMTNDGDLNDSQSIKVLTVDISSSQSSESLPVDTES